MTEKEKPQKQKYISHYSLSRWLFLRLLALVYFAAFISLSTQIKGLIGTQGIIPAHSYLSHISATMGFEKYFYYPTLAWFSTNDYYLQTICQMGAVLSIFLFIGFIPRIVLFLLWISYLSLTNISQEFMGYPWEGLLLETGFLAIFFAPSHVRPKKLVLEEKTSRVFLWLLLWLLFRLMFASSWLKLIHGDPTWKNLNTLTYHFETQPLPTWIGWYAHQLPAWLQKAVLTGTFAIEPLAPFCIFLWRNLRLKSFLTFTFLQVVLLLIGNYSFFNWLTLALCILLLDDHTIIGFIPKKLRPNLIHLPPAPVKKKIRQHGISVFVVVLIVFMSTLRMAELITGKPQVPIPLHYFVKTAESFHLVNRYGLFAMARKARREIIIEGSNDQQLWFPYEFKWKPGDLKIPPHFVAPHQPRLDWQMWHAAFSTYENTPWMKGLIYRLLQGSPDVLNLLKSAPFSTPPKYIRATVYQYHFTNRSTLEKWGTWWSRQFLRTYTPALSLKNFEGYQP